MKIIGSNTEDKNEQMEFSPKLSSVKTKFLPAGITLIELLVVITITGIIALAAFPNYQTNLRESRRQDAIIGIREMQLEVEAFILKNNQLPSAANFPVKDSSENFYFISYLKQNDNIYKIQAIAKADKTQAKDTAKGAAGDIVDCSKIYITTLLDSTYPYECN